MDAEWEQHGNQYSLSGDLMTAFVWPHASELGKWEWFVRCGKTRRGPADTVEDAKACALSVMRNLWLKMPETEWFHER